MEGLYFVTFVAGLKKPNDDDGGGDDDDETRRLFGTVNGKRRGRKQT
jgi:hypothetical protein